MATKRHAAKRASGSKRSKKLNRAKKVQSIKTLDHPIEISSWSFGATQ